MGSQMWQQATTFKRRARRILLPQDGTHRSLLNLSLSTVRLCMPDCQLTGSVPVKPLPESCSVCRAGIPPHVAGSVPGEPHCAEGLKIGNTISRLLCFC